MLTILKSTEQGLNTIETAVSGCWIHVVSPTPADMAELGRLGLPIEFLQHALDLDERARTERNDGALLIILRFPHAQGAEADVPFVTIPLSIIVTETMLVTIAPQPTGFLQQFAAGHVRGLSTGKPTRFVLNLLGHIAEQYLTRVREINQSMRN
jgi:magnesium transporter